MAGLLTSPSRKWTESSDAMHNDTLHNNLELEIADLREAGRAQISIALLDASLKHIGYERDIHSCCFSVWEVAAKRRKFKGVNYTVLESDTKRSVSNPLARRDANFQALESLRSRVYCIIGEAMVGF